MRLEFSTIMGGLGGMDTAFQEAAPPDLPERLRGRAGPSRTNASLKYSGHITFMYLVSCTSTLRSYYWFADKLIRNLACHVTPCHDRLKCTHGMCALVYFSFPTHPSLLQEFSHADPRLRMALVPPVRLGSFPKTPEAEEFHRHECHCWNLHKI